MGADVIQETAPGNQKMILEFVNNKPRFCVEVVLEGGLVRTRWCERGEEARAEARAGYVHYVEDYPEV